MTLGLWLPCGRYNFDREPPSDLRGGGTDATSLMDRISIHSHGFTRLSQLDIDGTNTAFAWFERFNEGSRQRLYVDSDGFIVAENFDKHELVSLLAPDPKYFVNRTAKGPTNAPELGILTPFQWNVLLEGIWNSALSLDVYFDIEDSTESAFTLERLLGDHIVHIPDEPLRPWKPLSSDLRSTIFLRSVRSLRNRHLLPIKWSVEAVRRRLFGETMSVLHRAEALHQLPIDGGEGSLGQILDDASEAQVRGYVMLVAAKFPLIENLSRLVSDCAGATIGLKDSGNQSRSLVLDVVTTWDQIVRMIDSNIDALEGSFRNSWQADMLLETSQMRVEAEAQGELQRETATVDTGRWFDTLLFVITFAATGAAVFLSVSEPSSGDAGLYAAVAAGILTVATFIYLTSLLIRRRYRAFVPQYEQVCRYGEKLPRSAHGPPGDGREEQWEAAIPTRISEHDLKAMKYMLSRSGRWLILKAVESDAVESDAALAVRSQGLRRHLRVDAPTEIDTVVRAHLQVEMRFARYPLAPFGRLLHRLSETLPRDRVSAQIAIELHKHAPSAKGPAIWILSEVRVTLLSRCRLEIHESTWALEVVDQIYLKRLLDPESFTRLSLSKRAATISSGPSPGSNAEPPGDPAQGDPAVSELGALAIVLRP